MESLCIVAGVLLLASGMLAVGHAAYLELISASALHWWDRPIVLAPVGLLMTLGGVFLVR